MIDIVSLLEDHSIGYATSGKNTSQGWAEVNCPFCSDPSFHLGINLSNGVFHCWVCGEKGGPEKLIQELLQVKYYDAKKLVEQYDIDTVQQEKITSTKKDKIEIPKEFIYELPELHKSYLRDRGFDPSYLQQKYNIMACYQLGRFSYRVMIPVIMSGEIVNFVGRDVTGKQKTKYLNMHNEEAVIPMKNCIYNIDSVQDKVILVEGVFDAWRLGDSAASLIGVEYTTQQLNILLEKEIKEAFILFDNDTTGIKKSEKLGNILSSFIPHVEIISLPDHVKDPAELSDEEAVRLKKELNF